MTGWLLVAAYAVMAGLCLRACWKSTTGHRWIDVTVSALWPLALLAMMLLAAPWRSMRTLSWWRGLAQRQRDALGLTQLDDRRLP